ncbi:hypothetical protein CYMTET_52972 [Cymbomonas tetramitiformis]|uniref:Fungal lipase-type domain-containing protein n=1 Tax=Cymbomonas tetramitiformis TaxID=36881 RepID=A0AAE0EQI4_9CHLO|nr:hypothetical protein CYMTET_52972 [Cymbomonas tetramitiformis]
MLIYCFHGCELQVLSAALSMVHKTKKQQLTSKLSRIGVSLYDLRQYARVANLAYVAFIHADDRAYVMRMFQIVKFDMFECELFNNASSNIHGITYHDHAADIAYIAFAGNDSVRDFFRDLDFAKVAIGEEKRKRRVHRGFYSGYLSVCQDILKFIESFSKDTTVILSGHSMGGALAVICAYDLKTRFPKLPIKVFTFGTPGVGNRRFKRAYNRLLRESTYTVYQPSDPIPKLPNQFIKSYWHVGTLLRIPDCPLVGKQRDKRGFDYHFPYVYIKQLHDLAVAGHSINFMDAQTARESFGAGRVVRASLGPVAHHCENFRSESIDSRVDPGDVALDFEETDFPAETEELDEDLHYPEDPQYSSSLKVDEGYLSAEGSLAIRCAAFESDCADFHSKTMNTSSSRAS